MKIKRIDLQLVVKGIKVINNRLDKLIKAVETSAGKGTVKKKSAPKKKVLKTKTAVKKTAQPVTAFDTVVKIISGSKQGVNASKIKDKTSFDDKKIANIIYKAKNRGLIKSVSKGVYRKV